MGESGLQGKGIGKRAHVRLPLLCFHDPESKQGLHPLARHQHAQYQSQQPFGFELEGVFLDDIAAGDRHQDVLRMALFKSLWLQIFYRSALAANHL